MIIKVDERPAEYFDPLWYFVNGIDFSMIMWTLKTSECGFMQGRAFTFDMILFISKLFLTFGRICDHKEMSVR
jgi:hypothetical protein